MFFHSLFTESNWGLTYVRWIQDCESLPCPLIDINVLCSSWLSAAYFRSEKHDNSDGDFTVARPTVRVVKAHPYLFTTAWVYSHHRACSAHSHRLLLNNSRKERAIDQYINTSTPLSPFLSRSNKRLTQIYWIRRPKSSSHPVIRLFLLNACAVSFPGACRFWYSCSSCGSGCWVYAPGGKGTLVPRWYCEYYVFKILNWCSMRSIRIWMGLS